MVELVLDGNALELLRLNYDTTYSIHHLVKVKVQNAPNTMDHNFTFALGCNSKLMQGKCVAKAS
jgi:hypothetical protein